MQSQPLRGTRWQVLVAIATVVGALGWGGGLVFDGRGGTMPDVPPSAFLVLVLFAAIVLTLALTTRSRLRASRERRPDAVALNPLTVARYGVLARASSPVGAGVVGLYGGYALFLAANLDEPGYGELAAYSGLAAAAGLGLVAAALFLEHVCRVPGDPSVTSNAMPHPRNQA
ncbi:MAG: DUF3180 domain-containing protein [Sporichthyaceae bacterium]